MAPGERLRLRPASRRGLYELERGLEAQGSVYLPLDGDIKVTLGGQELSLVVVDDAWTTELRAAGGHVVARFTAGQQGRGTVTTADGTRYALDFSGVGMAEARLVRAGGQPIATISLRDGMGLLTPEAELDGAAATFATAMAILRAAYATPQPVPETAWRPVGQRPGKGRRGRFGFSGGGAGGADGGSAGGWAWGSDGGGFGGGDGGGGSGGGGGDGGM